MNITLKNMTTLEVFRLLNHLSSKEKETLIIEEDNRAISPIEEVAVKKLYNDIYRDLASVGVQLNGINLFPYVMPLALTRTVAFMLDDDVLTNNKINQLIILVKRHGTVAQYRALSRKERLIELPKDNIPIETIEIEADYQDLIYYASLPYTRISLTGNTIDRRFNPIIDKILVANGNLDKIKECYERLENLTRPCGTNTSRFEYVNAGALMRSFIITLKGVTVEQFLNQDHEGRCITEVK